MALISIHSIDDIQAALQTMDVVGIQGGGSKPALAAATADTLDLRPLAGILEYEPGEFTFTARAGTTLATVRDALAEHGQYLPFDPPWVDAGATLGGTVAAGLSGAGRQRYGGVRDFLIGVRFVDGLGQLVRGGGKVVKNAAGFDLPKLMVGSLGQFGILTEVSFKVFPQPVAYQTLGIETGDLAAGLDQLRALTAAPLDFDALDLVLHAVGCTVLARLGGLPAALPARMDHAAKLLVGDAAAHRWEGADEARLWQEAREFTWVTDDAALVKVPLSPTVLPTLDGRLDAMQIPRRYAAGGHLAWLAPTGPVAPLAALLQELRLSGLVLRGNSGDPLIGHATGGAFFQAIKATLDPARKLPDFARTDAAMATTH